MSMWLDRSRGILWPLFSVFAGLTGCRRSPSFNVLGSYFPGWIACILISIGLSAGLHLILKKAGWERCLPLLPIFYLAIALSIACVLWLIAFE